MESARLIAGFARIVRDIGLAEQLAPSAVAGLNRAVAVSMAFGPRAGLELVNALASERSLQRYHLLPSARGGLLAKLGRSEEAGRTFQLATSLASNARERDFLPGSARDL